MRDLNKLDNDTLRELNQRYGVQEAGYELAYRQEDAARQGYYGDSPYFRSTGLYKDWKDSPGGKALSGSRVI